MKKTLCLFIILILVFANANAQYSRQTAEWIKFGGIGSSPGPVGTEAPADFYYGNAETRTSPVWFFATICKGGDIDLMCVPFPPFGYPDTISLVVWGPFTDTNSVQLDQQHFAGEYSENTDTTIIQQMNLPLFDLYWQSPDNSFYYMMVANSDTSKFTLGWENPSYSYLTDSFDCAICHGKTYYRGDPISGNSICIATVDSATGRIKLFLNNISPVVGFNIERENALGQFVSIGTIADAKNAVFIDSTSDPQKQSFSYNVIGTDSCGNLLNYGGGVSTIYLQSSLGLQGAINLNWTPYIGGFTFSTYYIYRSNSGVLQLIDSIVSSSTAYTDLTPPAGTDKYVVTIRRAPCDTTFRPATSASYIESRSNISETIATGIAKTDLPYGVQILPNPAHEFAIFRQGELKGKIHFLSILSATGQVIENIPIHTTSDQFIDVRQLTKGVYILQINADEIYHLKLVVD